MRTAHSASTARRSPTPALVVTLISLAACTSSDRIDGLIGVGGAGGGLMQVGGADGSPQGGESSTSTYAGGGPAGSGPMSSSGQGGSGGMGGEDTSILDAPPSLASTDLLCKLINDENNADPSPNATHTRANILGTDLGIPVAHGSDMFFFFGDTVGYQAIWSFAESVPDAVGYADDGRAAVAADPSVLCDGLRFLRLPVSESLGPSVDPAIQADFVGGSMTSPPGHVLAEYIKNPSGPPGQNVFPMMPGSFEVPSGAFSHAGSIYLFYTTVESSQSLSMKASYLARWSSPSKTGLPHYQILHSVDERFDALGPLRGRFINVAAEPHGSYVYLFGTGDFRHSPVHLARKALDSLDSAGGYEVYDAASGQWLAAPATQATPIIADAMFGETSVRYFSEIGAWMFLAQGGHRVVARFAEQPEGPWSDEITVQDATEPGFLAQYCCVPEGTCTGDRLFNCSKAGLYGTYLLPDVLVDTDGFTVAYTMSTWDPYNVALFSARFDLP